MKDMKVFNVLSKLLILRTVHLIQIMNVAVGGTNGYFPDDKNKPWKNIDPRAVNRFWDRKKYWQPSWGSGNQAALAIDSVKIWTKDRSKCLK
jgi:hypothetical protein